MKEPMFSINVTDLEKRVIIKALDYLKEKQKHENKNYDILDTLIIRTCDAPLVKGKGKLTYEER